MDHRTEPRIQGDAISRGNMPASKMTVREAFAMAALQGLVANSTDAYENTDNKEYAEWAVSQADWLLRELERGR